MRRWLIAIMILSGPWSIARADDPPTAAPAEATVVDDPEPERKTGSFRVGAGFSSDEHFIASAGIAQDDLFGTGQRLALSAELSEFRQDLRLRHDAPNLLDTGLDLTTELWTARRQRPGFVRNGTGGSITVGQEVERATRVFLRYRAEEAAALLDDPFAMRPVDQRFGVHTIAALGAGVEYDTLDERFLPRTGTRLVVDADVADRQLGSDVGLVRVSAALDHARPLGPFTLRLQGRAGYVRGRGGDVVPLSERYQFDGHADLRGYPMSAIGVGLDGVAGGFDGEAYARAELELPVIRRAGLSLAAFADAGAGYNADATWGPIGATVRRSVGVSIIWRSPIGPLRFDWAMPLDGGEPQFLFGGGASF